MVQRTGVHRRMAASVRRTAEQSAYRHRQMHLGTVRSVSPFRIEVHDRADVVQEHIDLMPSQFIRFYHTSWGVKAGDTAYLMQVGGVFWWFDVQSEKDCSPPAAKVPWYDPSG